ncbi:MAG: hypothetical protein FWG64_06375 [Firmicutes bacterium]|nr:hypothetical protein [Bacillota bacterium]
MAMLSKLKQKINALLERMAQENESQFGNATMTCCGLNEKGKPKKQEGL